MVVCAVVPVLEREGSRRDTAMLNQCLVGQVSYLLLFRFLFYHQVGARSPPSRADATENAWGVTTAHAARRGALSRAARRVRGGHEPAAWRGRRIRAPFIRAAVHGRAAQAERAGRQQQSARRAPPPDQAPLAA